MPKLADMANFLPERGAVANFFPELSADTGVDAPDVKQPAEILKIVRAQMRALMLFVDGALGADAFDAAGDSQLGCSLEPVHIKACDANAGGHLCGPAAISCGQGCTVAPAWPVGDDPPCSEFSHAVPRFTSCCMAETSSTSEQPPLPDGAQRSASGSTHSAGEKEWKSEGSSGLELCGVQSSDQIRQVYAEKFSNLDTRGRGALSTQDCQELLARHGKHMELHAIAIMLKHVDKMASGDAHQPEPFLTFDAFYYFMTHSATGTHGETSRNLETLRTALQREIRDKPYRSSSMESLTDPSRSDGDLRPMLAVGLDTFPAFVIMLNALQIGIETDYGNYHIWFWEFCELFFAAFFTCELFVKYWLFGCKHFWCGQGEAWWNYFDVFCVAAALTDIAITYGTSLFGDGVFELKGMLLIKMLRLARLARLVRMLRFKVFRELRMIIQGIAHGVRVLFWAFVLLFSVIFTLGILMRRLVGDNTEEFGTLPASMFTLFRCFTDGCSAYDGTPLPEELREEHGIVWMLGYMIVSLFVTMGMFNLIMAIFIDNVVTAQMHRKQAQLGENAEVMELRICEAFAKRVSDSNIAALTLSGKLQESLEVMEGAELQTLSAANFQSRRHAANTFLAAFEEEELAVTRDAFSNWLHNREVIEVLEAAEVETATKHELFDALDVDSGGELTMDELICGLMKLRGPISKMDIVATRLKVAYMTELVEDICRKIGVALSCDKDHVRMESEAQVLRSRGRARDD